MKVDSPTPPPVPQPTNRKRKRGAAAPSPAPGETENSSDAVLSVKHSDLFSRPVLTISRSPSFVPITEGSIWCSTELLPNNRIGFFYTPAGIKPDAAKYTVTCRTIESRPPSYRVSWEDRSPFIKVSKDGLSLLGDKGFRSARCNAPVREGRWYFEAKVTRGGGERPPELKRKEGSYVRLGWARREAPLNGPVGLDGYSYGIRDKTGEKVTLSRTRPYGKSFATGDVIGMYISLPPKRMANPNDPNDSARLHRQRIAIEFKGQEYFESLEYTQTKEMIALMDYSSKAPVVTSLPSSTSKKSGSAKNVPDRGRAKVAPVEVPSARPLSVLSQSCIAFFINGECQGVAFEDIYDYLQLPRLPQTKGKEKKRNREGAREHQENPYDDGYLGYYPFISLFNYASVQINPGPNFDFPPPNDVDAMLDGKLDMDSPERTWRPMCERYEEFMKEQWALDELEEEEVKLEIAKRAEEEQIQNSKKLQKDKKRQQAEARRRSKKAASSTPFPEDHRFTASLPPGQPSPLRYGYTEEDLGSQEHSPAPTATSNAGIHWVHSSYTPENGDGEHLERKEIGGVPSIPPDTSEPRI